MISGYVTNEYGNGLAGATVIFNAPTLIPSATTDGSGYWSTSGSPGTYHINVWPPFDSNYINYDEVGFQLTGDTTKNITLSTGCKVYGYITDSSGNPVVGAAVLFCINNINYGSGYFSKSNGYYFLAVPTGTYTIDAHPRTDTTQGVTSFSRYYEYDVAVRCNLRKDIAVNMPNTTPAPTPKPKYIISGYIADSTGKGIANAEVIFNVPSIVTSVFSGDSGYYQILAPEGTYHVNVWPPFDSHYMSCDLASLRVTGNLTKDFTLETGYKVHGYITDLAGVPISKAIVVLNGYLSGWFSKSDGYYALAVPAGTYTIDCHSGVGATGNALTRFPTYYEYHFTVNGDTMKNITVGGPRNPEPTPTLTPSASTPQPTTHATNQANQATPHKTYAPRQAEVTKPVDNTTEYILLIAAITVVPIIAAFGLSKFFRGRKPLYPEEEQRYH
jgi:hypothetical protein